MYRFLVWLFIFEEWLIPWFIGINPCTGFRYGCLFSRKNNDIFYFISFFLPRGDIRRGKEETRHPSHVVSIKFVHQNSLSQRHVCLTHLQRRYKKAQKYMCVPLPTSVSWDTIVVQHTQNPNKHEVSECDGWVCVLEVIVVPSMLRLTRKTVTLTRVLPTLFSVVKRRDVVKVE